jgi:hypothetical protein
VRLIRQKTTNHTNKADRTPILLKDWLDLTRTALTPALAALILSVFSFHLRKNKKTGREEGEKSEYAIPFVSVRDVRG